MKDNNNVLIKAILALLFFMVVYLTVRIFDDPGFMNAPVKTIKAGLRDFF